MPPASSSKTSSDRAEAPEPVPANVWIAAPHDYETKTTAANAARLYLQSANPNDDLFRHTLETVGGRTLNLSRKTANDKRFSYTLSSKAPSDHDRNRWYPMTTEETVSLGVGNRPFQQKLPIPIGSIQQLTVMIGNTTRLKHQDVHKEGDVPHLTWSKATDGFSHQCNAESSLGKVTRVRDFNGKEYTVKPQVSVEPDHTVRWTIDSSLVPPPPPGEVDRVLSQYGNVKPSHIDGELTEVA